MPYERDYLLPLFSAPRPAPLPSPRSSRSSPPPQGFVVPPIPPRDCPLSIIIDEAGHRRLPLVSGNPLPVDHERARKLVRHRLDITAKCANCAEMAIDCEFFEAGVPCPPCVVLGIPDCQFADPHDFMLNLRHRRDAHFLHEREVLCAAVRDNQLAPSLFEREYEHACSWFYSAAQGAISRFLINCHSTGQLAFRAIKPSPPHLPMPACFPVSFPSDTMPASIPRFFVPSWTAFRSSSCRILKN
ncbi:hypothetical protein FB451DRAFT_1300868, partial [Mycena latifolia]